MKGLKSVLLALSVLLSATLPSFAVSDGVSASDDTSKDEDVDFFDNQVNDSKKVKTGTVTTDKAPSEQTSDSSSLTKDSAPETNSKSSADDSWPGETGKDSKMGDIGTDNSEAVPDHALKGFVDLLTPSEAPTLKPLTPTMDGIGAQLDANVDTNTLSSSTSLNAMDERRRQVAESVTRFGTPSILLYTTGNGNWLVTKPLRGGAAEVAGMRSGDRIWSVDGHPVPHSLDMKVAYHMITGTRGQTKIFQIQRGGSYYNLPVRLFNVYEIRDQTSQYVEYYWYLLYNGIISVSQYQRMMSRFQ